MATTEQYTYRSASRRNLPTEQTEPLMTPDDREPIRHMPAQRERDDDPVLAWNRSDTDDNEPGHLAHPLYVREKVHPGAFVKLLQGGGEQPALFESFNGLPSPSAAYEWYRHSQNWQNRIIHGESTRVAASLIAREHMAGQVQMIYFDPPYGMGYKSNFQVATNDKNTADKAEGRPNDTRTIAVFRDTYERGIHSYLDLTLEKLWLFRELLSESGSLFVQIGDENVHRVAVLLDEVFGSANRVATITYRPTTGSTAGTLPESASYVLWYAKDKPQVKYQQLYEPLSRKQLVEQWGKSFAPARVQEPDGTTRALTRLEQADPDGALPEGSRLYQRGDSTSQHPSTTGRTCEYEFEGVAYHSGENSQWRVSVPNEISSAVEDQPPTGEAPPCGMDRLAELGRLEGTGEGGGLYWKRYEEEMPGRRIDNVWHTMMRATGNRYVVETATSVIERCVLMATDPGDLVFDPTCGGATTAFAAEKWARRWITCDTSPVAVAIARQRLATATFPYWLLADSAEGAEEESKLSSGHAVSPGGGWGHDPVGGFVYERRPKVSAAILAYDLDPDPTLLVDQPRRKGNVIRVASPLTVESESPWSVALPFDHDAHDAPHPNGGVGHSDYADAVREALLAHTIRGGRDNHDITVRSLDPWPATSTLLAWRAAYTVGAAAAEHVAAVVVAAEDVTVPRAMVREAAQELADGAVAADLLIVVAYQFGPDVRSNVGHVRIAKVQANRDLQIRGLSPENDHHAFVILGEPDVEIEELADGRIVVELHGYDTYDPDIGNATEGIACKDVACWMVDTDHDGESFFARRLHFPRGAKDRQVKALLTRRLDEAEKAALTALRTAPFTPPQSGKVAVKIVTNTGMEMSTVISLGDEHMAE